MKRIAMLAAAALLLLFSVGCAAETQEAPAETQNSTIVYSNLADPESRTLLSQLITNAGIADRHREVLFKHVDQINELMRPEELTTGFEPLGTSKYDSYDLQDRWTAAYPNFMGYNCRITAYSLFQDLVTVPEDASTTPDIILFDLQALEADSTACPGREHQFEALYSNVPTENTQDIEVHLKHIQEDWRKRGIRFADAPGARLISVIFHDLLNESTPTLFIGHTGILFPQGEDGLYFLEKIAFEEPYQLLRFQNRQELNDYLMGKYDLDYDQSTAAPFILENDQLMQGYRRLDRAQ